MQLVMLAGERNTNRAWVSQAHGQFKGLFESFHIQDYAHWKIGGGHINLQTELDVLLGQVPLFEKDYAVFAKSVGTVLVAKAIERQVFRPKWMLLCGIPLKTVEPDYPEFANVLAAAEVPTVIVQNQHDPRGSADAVWSFMESAFAGRDNFWLVEPSGDTHDYVDFSVLTPQLIKLRDHR